MARNKGKKQKPKQQQKEEIFGLLAREYQQAPEDLWSCYPDIAAKMEKFYTPKKSSSIDMFQYSHLTERDITFRLNTLDVIMKKFSDGTVSREEAIKAFENAAALKEHAAIYKDNLLRLLEKTLDFPLEAAKEKTVYFQKGKPEHHTYVLARGMTLSLTWDRRLIKIVFDPREFALRRQALAFVGAGSDKASDVARRHDDYLGDALGR